MGGAGGGACCHEVKSPSVVCVHLWCMSLCTVPSSDRAVLHHQSP